MNPTQRAMIGIALDLVGRMEAYMWVHNPAAFSKIKTLFVADFLGVKESDVIEVVKGRDAEAMRRHMAATDGLSLAQRERGETWENRT